MSNNIDMNNRPMPVYDVKKSYDENYEKGPFFAEDELKNINPDGDKKPAYRFFDFLLHSPLGVPAGLLLNSHWVSLYSRLGFDILTYKTVRTSKQESHPLPNCLFINSNEAFSLNNPPEELKATDIQPEEINRITITNSFGMPSKTPDEWQEDVEKSKKLLKSGQILIVSVVGKSKNDRTDGLIEDFLKAAIMAKDAGADIIELNLSCPNVGQDKDMTFKYPELVLAITKKVSKAISPTPLFIKAGYIENENKMRELLKTTAGYIHGIAGINSLQAKVVNEHLAPALGPARIKSGVCGSAIKPFGLNFVKLAHEIQKKEKYNIAVIGTGGITSPYDVNQYLEYGANAAMTCTGAMFNPYLAVKWKQKTND